MTEFIIQFIIIAIVITLLRVIHNYIYLKYKNSRYKYIAYSLLFIGGSLSMFALLSFTSEISKTQKVEFKYDMTPISDFQNK